MTTLLLVRHAHTAANDLERKPVMSGWADVPLSTRGVKQLTTLASADLGEVAPVIYSSDSIRTLHTAGSFAQGRRIVPLRSLREISCGDVDGWRVATVQERYPELWQRNLAQNDPDFRWPGGESYRELRTRVLRAMRGIASRHRGERVAVVTHTGVITQVMNHAKGLSPANWKRWRAANASVTTIEWDDDDRVRVIRFSATM
jgi:broad specificity phosphatase PhoE